MANSENTHPDITGGLRPTTRDRKEISLRYTWDLTHIYTGWKEWESDLNTVEGLMGSYKAFEGSLAEGPRRILEASVLSDQLGQLAYKVYRYPGLMQNQDTRDNQVKARLDRVQILFARFHQATAWYGPELLRIPEETMRRWLEETPALAPYRFGILETYRKQKHVLDENGERLLAYAEPFGSTPAESYSMLADADVAYPSVTLGDGSEVIAGHASYQNGLHTQRSQADRETLFKAHFEVFNRTPNTWASIYEGVLQRDWFLTQARGYSTTLGAHLDGDNIPVAVVETLIQTAREGVAPLRRYHALRKRILRLEKYRYFDAYLPLVDVDWRLAYDDVVPLIIDSVAIFGAEYQETVREAFARRWIDVYESDGKRSGAFSAGVYGIHPYMLLNYADTLNDAFTVAHEMGHTMHTVLSHQHQPFATSEYTIFVAEVASMTNENLFLEFLLQRETDPARRIALLQHAIDDICAGFYRQAMFADFELQAHRLVENGKPVTAEILQKLYLEILYTFFGDTLDDQIWYHNTWARIPHFFASPYYVYQYATSKAAATLVHQCLTTGSETERHTALDRYLALLSSGGNDHPVEQMKRAGVDFGTPEPMRAMVATAERLVGELEKSLQLSD
ncbi:MAG: oligoendopeptidase F [Thermoanaerobaculales bacterium]|nr:oligoendopeptidase F [Thermoanaerobaculales bacterium]